MRNILRGFVAAYIFDGLEGFFLGEVSMFKLLFSRDNFRIAKNPLGKKAGYTFKFLGVKRGGHFWHSIKNRIRIIAGRSK